MDLRSYKTDPELEVAGKVVVIDETTSITVARFNNTKFRKMQDRLTEPYQKRAGREGISDEQADEILSECMSSHLLVGWKGLLLDGKEIEYSKENALQLLTDPTLKDFKELVLFESQRIDNFRAERLDADSKNSKKQSSTKADGQKNSASSSKQ